MGSSAELSPLVLPQMQSYGIKDQLGGTGQNFLNDLINRQNEGLPGALKEMIKGEAEALANASLVSAKRMAKEGLSGKQVPTGSLVRAMSDLYTQKANQMMGVNKDLALSDYETQMKNRDKALSGFMGLQGLAAQLAGSKNQFNLSTAGMQNEYNMNQYKIDKENEFNWGDALGSFLGMSGTIGGALIGKPKGVSGKLDPMKLNLKNYG